MSGTEERGNDDVLDAKPQEILEMDSVPADSLQRDDEQSAASEADNDVVRASSPLRKEDEGPVVTEKQEAIESALLQEDSVDSEDVDGTEDEGEGEAAAAGGDSEAKTLEDADKLMEEGSDAMKKRDYALAVDRFSRALEIRVGHFGELGAECLQTYYKYGCALLYKAQDENEALAIGDAVTKKTQGSAQCERLANGEGSSHRSEKKETRSGRPGKQIEVIKDQDADEKEIENGEDDGEDVEIREEEESDLDLAFNLLDIARVIAEKNIPGDTMEKVDIISALGDVSLEREDIENSLADYKRALSMLERLVEPDSRLLAEIHFKLCMTLQMDNKIKDAIPHCKMAISVCEARSQRLKLEVSNSSDDSTLEKEAEIKTLDDLLADLNAKLEDLQEMPSLPSLAEIMESFKTGLPVHKTGASSTGPSETIAKSGGVGVSTPTSSVSNNQVVHLGVVGRGVKRAAPIPIDKHEEPSKKSMPSSPVVAGTGANDALDPDSQVSESK